MLRGNNIIYNLQKGFYLDVYSGSYFESYVAITMNESFVKIIRNIEMDMYAKQK